MNARKINSTIGGFVIVNMNLMKAVSLRKYLECDVDRK